MEHGLFIDNERNPIDVHWIEFDYDSMHWTIVRSYNDFIKILTEEEFAVISFDHDLDDTSTFECIRCNTHQQDFDYSKINQKTGYHCAIWLKGFCKREGIEIPNYLVHSLNEKGRANIIKVLGQDKLIATHNPLILFEKADEILEKRKKWSK